MERIPPIMNNQTEPVRTKPVWLIDLNKSTLEM